MDRRMIRPLIGTLAAIAITAVMDANGLSMFSALPLLPLGLLLWAWERFSRREMGLAWGRPRDYGLALLYPLVVISAATLIALLAGVVDLSEANWKLFWINLLAGSTMGVLMVLLTEEGFFRGWLWASLGRAGRSQNQVLLWSSIAFTLWHVSAVSLDTGFDLPVKQIMVYLPTAFLLGLIWGMLRLISGSALVAAFSHAVWNGLTYGLFAYGTKVGALGVQDTSIYGPEVGYVGLVLNTAFAAWLWTRVRSRELEGPDDATASPSET
jgi:membrane protease YdiL (CAAX protease family)